MTGEPRKADLQDLYHRFDGVEPGGNTRIAWYGQARALGMTHEEAVADTYERFSGWCQEYWPKRGIALP